ncbi:dipeptidase [Tessaracoccus flavus]|jgi:acetylornithine deacetylase/succinyl-diaminopimelate desuccinylase-like protein|uniref:Dipeptidase n=1 Tax=Tessaracoccus flavus TaxID=1610493 RepID=A0A1Q2CCA0_9ACTN|nr:dipeptidase [Tessaracoccus flavus]AQP43739.1 dipeptidase [Tessaracoccus flavus]SDY22424.1 Acetylornithine deacetylase/Succinyl-diaminopimelate desuccinylase [Tessaracoccus flavus]
MSVTESVNAVLPSVIADLKRLIAIPSVSSLPEHHDDVLAAADTVADLLRGVGCPEVRLLDGGGKPAVYGHFPAPEGAPTVLLYAHYDVQPTGDAAGWTTDAFSPMEREGRLYARGSADDKGGIAVHLAALRAFDGKPPVGVKVFIEGEEEIGSPSMKDLLDAHPEETSADLFIIADSMNWQVGQPALTTTLRGLIDAVVTVSTLESGVHSGQYGGLVPDAVTALCRLLSTLHDEEGNVAIKGLVQDPDPEVDYDHDALRAEAGVLDGVELFGDGKASARMWTRPAVSIVGIDTTSIKDASNTLIPSARAKVSVRIAPSQDPVAAEAALREHLTANAPWGARVEIDPERGGSGTRIDLSDPRARVAVEALEEAFGVAPVEMGVGGSIPIANEFAERNPGSLVLLTAVVDPTSRMHGLNESLDMGDFAKAALAETILLANLAT